MTNMKKIYQGEWMLQVLLSKHPWKAIERGVGPMLNSPLYEYQPPTQVIWELCNEEEAPHALTDFIMLVMLAEGHGLPEVEYKAPPLPKPWWTVILARPAGLLEKFHQYDGCYGGQLENLYVAKVRASNTKDSISLAQAEAFAADQKEYQRVKKPIFKGYLPSSYTMLLTFYGKPKLAHLR